MKAKSHDRIMDFVTAATPIVDRLVDCTLSSEDEYLIERLSKSDIMKKPAGSVDLLEVLSKLG